MMLISDSSIGWKVQQTFISISKMKTIIEMKRRKNKSMIFFSVRYNKAINIINFFFQRVTSFFIPTKNSADLLLIKKVIATLTSSSNWKWISFECSFQFERSENLKEPDLDCKVDTIWPQILNSQEHQEFCTRCSTKHCCSDRMHFKSRSKLYKENLSIFGIFV